ncbi:unnamed protein product [Amoebophrya sp. A120]|nr:unnamed protein product [Amoebophrya sp. A120]|eukprot:GSA120T00023562001.1
MNYTSVWTVSRSCTLSLTSATGRCGVRQKHCICCAGGARAGSCKRSFRTILGTHTNSSEDFVYRNLMMY